MEEKITFSETQCTKQLNGVEDAIYVIGGKWKLRIIIALNNGHTRFNDLQRTIKGISARVLSNELKQLELNGLVKRTVQPDQFPVIIAYQATEYATTLKDVVSSLAEWGENHRKKITAN